MTPYYADDDVTLYLGDCREVLPTLGQQFDCVVADPPYEETAHNWDHWPTGWLNTVARVSISMWCWLPMRQFAEPPFRGQEFCSAGWRLSHDVEGEWTTIWEKHNGSGFQADRFRRVHEPVTHWYCPPWSAVHRAVPRTAWDGPNNGRAGKRKANPAHTGSIAAAGWDDNGTRLARSVIRARRTYKAIHPTEKPVEVLRPLIEYACPVGGTVLDPFAGSGATAVAARLSGRRAVLIEADEKYCEAAARRLSQDVLPIGGDTR